MKEKEITLACPNCSKKNRVPIRIFYDGYEGPIMCNDCGEDLEVDEGE